MAFARRPALRIRFVWVAVDRLVVWASIPRSLAAAVGTSLMPAFRRAAETRVARRGGLDKMTDFAETLKPLAVSIFTKVWATWTI
jgi:hypothetical protein